MTGDVRPSRSLNRRTLLRAAGGAMTALGWTGAGGLLAPVAARAGATDPLALIRERRRHLLVGDGSSGDPDLARIVAGVDAEAARLWAAMERDPARLFLWPDVASRTDPSHHRVSYDRLRTMASAYATPGSVLADDPALAGDLIAALDWLYDHRYNPELPAVGNWWEWEIGAPLRLNDISVLLRDSLGPERLGRYMDAVGHFAPNVSGSGANLVWRCSVATLQAANSGDPARLATVRDRIGEVFPYVADGDGFYRDGSFIQHQDFAYTGGYGTSLLLYLSDLLALLAGTPWESTHPDRDNVFAWVFDAFDPFLHRGAMMDMVRGREMSRYYQTDRITGHVVLGAVLSIAQFAPAPEAAAMRAMVKGHLQADTHRDFFDYDPEATERTRVGTAALAKGVLAGAAPGRGDLVAHRQFPAMDRVVHLREGFGIGISMSSRRTRTYEAINNENSRAWYSADGMTYLYNDDLGHYTDQFWSTVDWYRLPGTTVDNRSRERATTYRPPTSWAGGAVLDDRYGAVGMDLKADGASLVAHKSWFCLDDQVLCLGAGITSADGRPVETIVENRKYAEGAAPAVTIDGRAVTLPYGEDVVLTGARWLHLDGAGGYVFPAPATIRVRRDTRTGRWTDFNRQVRQDPTPHTRTYVSAVIDHGTDPDGATYAYALLPGASAADLRRYAGTTVDVVANTAAVQAVRVRRDGLVLATFWAASGGEAAGVAVDAMAAVVTRRSGDRLDVAVSDPTQENTGAILVELDHPAGRLVESDDRITVLQLAPTVRFEVAVDGAAGRSLVARFAV